MKTGNLFAIHVFSRIKKIVYCFLLRSFIKIIKNIWFRLCNIYCERTGPCFPGYSVSQESEWLLFSPCAYFPGPAWRVKSSQWRYPSVPPSQILFRMLRPILHPGQGWMFFNKYIINILNCAKKILSFSKKYFIIFMKWI